MTIGRDQTAFVTGASGFLGGEITKQLLETGHRVIALSRSGRLPGDLPSERLEVLAGDLDDEAPITEAMRGAAVVYHVAGDVRMWRRFWPEIAHTNVDGTRTMVRAARAAGVDRFVFTSSGATVGKPFPPTREVVSVDEDSAYNLAALKWAYPHTKWLAEREVEAAVAQGLDAVTLHPTGVLGPGDWKGNVLPLFRATRGVTSAVVPNGYRTTCDVRDVAAAHLTAARRGRTGRHYLLGGEQLSLFELFTRIAHAAGGRAPWFELPDAVVYAAGWASDLVADVTGRPPALSYEMAQQSTLRVRMSSDRAIAELGYTPRPLDESLADAVAFYRAQGSL